MNEKPSSASRFVSQVRVGMEPSDVGDGLDWPGQDLYRNITPFERVEELVTMFFFLLMFVVILMGVFWRYVLNDPLIWTVNLATIAFIWSVMVGAGLPNWTDTHIQFDLLYGYMPAKHQRISRMVGNLLIVVTFTLPIPATIDYLLFIRVDTVTGLSLSFALAFAAILWFLVATVFHRGRLLVIDVGAIVSEHRSLS